MPEFRHSCPPRDLIQIILSYLFFDPVRLLMIIELEYRQWTRFLCIESEERKKWHLWVEAMQYEHWSYLNKEQESETIEVSKCPGCKEWVTLLNDYQTKEHRCCIDDLGNPTCGDYIKTCRNCETILDHGSGRTESNRTVKKRNAMLLLKQLNDDTKVCLKECNLSRRAVFRRKRKQTKRQQDL